MLRIPLLLCALFLGALACHGQEKVAATGEELRSRLQKSYIEIQEAKAEREAVMGEVLYVTVLGAGGIIALLLVLYRQQSRANRRLAGLNEQLARQHVALSKANAELERLNKEMNDVLSVVSHDLKSPLAGIEGLTHELRESLDENDSAKAPMLEMIENAARQMFVLVSNVLDLQRIEAGHAGIRPEPLNVSTVAQDVVNELDFAIRQKRQTVVQTGATEAWAMGDESAVRRVMSNLLSNASKYSPFGARIELNVRAGGTPTVSVLDSGPGISPKDQERLFQKFTRLTARPTGGEGSTGLGLAICRSLVSAMDGEIWCESSLGHGSTFSFSLPGAKPAEKRARHTAGQNGQ